MGTNALIAVKQADGKVKAIYVHYDGYVRHVGKMLETHYNTLDKANAVVALGALSCLYESIECPEGHSFAKPVEGYTVAYGRDRGEIGTAADTYRNEDTFNANADCGSYDYNYIFKSGKWYFRKGGVKTWRSVSNELEIMEASDAE